MKNKKFMKLAVLSSVAMVCFYASELSAWERTAMDDCKKDESSCKKDAKQCTSDSKTCKKQMDDCKTDYEQCKKNATSTNEASFENELSPYAASMFRHFTPEQRKKALDYADGNDMSPDDAVAKVMKKNN